jgi:hypothetical protein
LDTSISTSDVYRKFSNVILLTNLVFSAISPQMQYKYWTAYKHILFLHCISLNTAITK